MFAYCANNPVNRIDPTGDLFWALIGAVVFVGLIVAPSSSHNQAPYKKQAAKEKYNDNTINITENDIGTDPDKLNVTFYPDSGLIHIEESHSIATREEKMAVIDVIVNSNYYDPTIYGDSTDRMLIEWSAHNFCYRTSSSSDLMYKFYQWRGFDDPIESTRSVDFRRSLEPSVERNYNIVTLWGAIQW